MHDRLVVSDWRPLRGVHLLPQDITTADYQTKMDFTDLRSMKGRFGCASEILARQQGAWPKSGVANPGKSALQLHLPACLSALLISLTDDVDVSMADISGEVHCLSHVIFAITDIC